MSVHIAEAQWEGPRVWIPDPCDTLLGVLMIGLSRKLKGRSAWIIGVCVPGIFRGVSVHESESIPCGIASQSVSFYHCATDWPLFYFIVLSLFFHLERKKQTQRQILQQDLHVIIHPQPAWIHPSQPNMYREVPEWELGTFPYGTSCVTVGPPSGTDRTLSLIMHPGDLKMTHH